MRPFLLQPQPGSSPALPTYSDGHDDDDDDGDLNLASPPAAPTGSEDKLHLQQQQQQRRTPVSPPRASKLSRPATSASSPKPFLAPSDSFMPVPTSDAEYVRLTYAWFEKSGVKGDGWSAGQEWTRERSRGSKAVWDVVMESRQGVKRSASRAKRAATPAAIDDAANLLKPRTSNLRRPSEDRIDEGRSSLSPNDGRARTRSLSSSRRPSSSSLRQRAAADTATERSTSPLPADDTSAASGSRSNLARLARDEVDEVEHLQESDADDTWHEEASALSEDEEEARRALRVDRYGFFASDGDDDKSGSRSRSTVLRTSALMATPSRRLLGRSGGASKRNKGSAGGRFARRRGGSKKSSSEPPSSSKPFSPAFSELSVEAKRQAEKEEELRKVVDVRRRKETGLRTKEDSRVGKWRSMLVAREAATTTGPAASEKASTRPDGMREGEAEEEGKEYDLAPGRKTAKKLRGRIYKGVPDRWRSAVWWALVRSAHRQEVKWEKSHPSLRKVELEGIGRAGAEGKLPVLVEKPPPLGESSAAAAAAAAIIAADKVISSPTPSLDAHHLTPEAAEARFPQLIHLSSCHDVQIDLDVPRTISGHVLFHTRYGKGQRNLFHVLHAFSLLCDRCAYCQGMGPIAATLLQYLSPARSYAFLVAMHDLRLWSLHKTFSPGFPGLVENFYVQKQLLLWMLPGVAKTLERHGVSLSSFATRWYITLFSNVVPFETQLRLWDALMLEGEDVLVVFSLAILWSLRRELGDEREASFEMVLGTLSGEFVPEDDETLMRWTGNMMAKEVVRGRIHRARYEWADMVVRGEADGALL